MEGVCATVFVPGQVMGVTVLALLGQRIAHSPEVDTVIFFIFFFSVLLLQGLIGVTAHLHYATSIE